MAFFPPLFSRHQTNSVVALAFVINLLSLLLLVAGPRCSRLHVTDLLPYSNSFAQSLFGVILDKQATIVLSLLLSSSAPPPTLGQSNQQIRARALQINTRDQH